MGWGVGERLKGEVPGQPWSLDGGLFPDKHGRSRKMLACALEWVRVCLCVCVWGLSGAGAGVHSAWNEES